MAFCTMCGAQVSGAFCNQCGTPAAAAAAPTPPPPGAPMPAAPVAANYAPAVAPLPPPRKTSPLVWVLIVIAGFFILCGIFIVGTGLFVMHKARQAGFDPALMSRNPGLAVSKMIAAVNPDAEVLSTDDGAGTLTVRDRKTGKVVTLKFDDVKNGRFSMSAQGDDGKTATMEIGGAAGKLPSWVPEYPGSAATGTFSIKGITDDMTDAGSFAFTTSDASAKVMAFYRDKAKDLGLKVNMETTAPGGGMIVAVDEGEKHSLMVIVGTDEQRQTTVSMTYGRKK